MGDVEAMRILYGVVGEGMGHAIRSAVVIEYLRGRGHDVRVAASGRAVDYLTQRSPDPKTVIPITGLSLVYRDNMVSTVRTALQNLRAVSGLPKNVRTFLSTAQEFQPDIVITDFESWSYWFARSMNVPVISVDNMQIIHRCRLSEDMLEGHQRDFQVARNIVRAKVPRCNAFMITTFFYPPLDKDRTTLHPPILRPEIIGAKDRVRIEDHVLVYQTGTHHEALVAELKKLDHPFRVYGLKRDLAADEEDDNLLFRPFSPTRFIEDLSSCRAVISGGGFTLMGEALFLGKPMFSIPVANQFEQVLNARYLAALKYGESASEVRADAVDGFLSQAPRYRAMLEGFREDRNQGFFEQLEVRMRSAIDEGALAP
jgi:uncharacterized protein (TIGR00661 family)